jgi:hypothetical protein
MKCPVIFTRGAYVRNPKTTAKLLIITLLALVGATSMIWRETLPASYRNDLYAAALTLCAIVLLLCSVLHDSLLLSRKTKELLAAREELAALSKANIYGGIGMQDEYANLRLYYEIKVVNLESLLKDIG